MTGSVLGVQAEGVAGTKAPPDAGGSLHGVYTEPTGIGLKLDSRQRREQQ